MKSNLATVSAGRLAHNFSLSLWGTFESCQLQLWLVSSTGICRRHRSTNTPGTWSEYLYRVFACSVFGVNCQSLPATVICLSTSSHSQCKCSTVKQRSHCAVWELSQLFLILSCQSYMTFVCCKSIDADSKLYPPFIHQSSQEQDLYIYIYTSFAHCSSICFAIHHPTTFLFMWLMIWYFWLAEIQCLLLSLSLHSVVLRRISSPCRSQNTSNQF